MEALIAPLVGAIFVIRRWPETKIAQWLHIQLVVQPAQSLNEFSGLKRQNFIYFLILSALMLSAGQMMAALGSADLAIIYAADLALYIDAVIAITMTAIMTGLKSALYAGRTNLASLKSLLNGRGKIAKSRRKRRARLLAIKAENDDDHHFGATYLRAG